MATGLGLKLLEVNGAVDGANAFYILSKDYYDGLGTITGVQAVEDPTGEEMPVRVHVALKTGNLLRIGAKIKDGETIKRVSLLVSRDKLSDLFTDGGKSALDGKSVSRDGTNLGTIESIFFRVSRYLLPS